MALYTSYYTKQLALRPEAATAFDANVEGERTITKSVARRTIDLWGPYINWFEKRSMVRHPLDTPALLATSASALDLLPPFAYAHQPASSFAVKFAQQAPTKTRSSANVVVWTADGRRCLTGTQGGEFTMWGSQAFQFETILQAHETPVRSMVFTHNGNFLLSGDDSGSVRYWKPNLELVKSVQAHREAVRQVAFSPTDLKYATASDDSTVKVWDFARCQTEQTCAGHGGDVKCVDWHPAKSLLVSASKDALLKLWCPKSGQVLSTMHGHKGTIMSAQWNANGNWVLTASRDQTCKVYDIRVQRELASFRGHNRDVISASWHPLHEELFVSGGYDGSLIFWLAGRQAPQAEVRGAHEGSVWAAAWHPGGHLLATGAADGATKFWCRSRPGDPFFEHQQAQQEELAAISAAADEAAARQHQPAPAPLLFNTGPEASSTPGMGAIPGIGEALTTPVVLAVPAPAPPAAPAAPLDIFAIPEPVVDLDATLARAGGPRALLPGEPRGPMRSGSARLPPPRRRGWEEGGRRGDRDRGGGDWGDHRSRKRSPHRRERSPPPPSKAPRRGDADRGPGHPRSPQGGRFPADDGRGRRYNPGERDEERGADRGPGAGRMPLGRDWREPDGQAPRILQPGLGPGHGGLPQGGAVMGPGPGPAQGGGLQQGLPMQLPRGALTPNLPPGTLIIIPQGRGHGPPQDRRGGGRGEAPRRGGRGRGRGR